MLIAIDFDGTIVKHAFPRIGEPMPRAFEVIKRLKEAGHKLILWTCREDEGFNINRQYLSDAVKFCKENGVEFDAVNETIQGEEFRDPKYDQRKPYCHLFIDDRNLGGFPGWDVVEMMILDGKEASWSVDA